MDKLSLKLEPRTITGKKVKNLRKTGLVPASICGKGVQSESFQLDAREFGLVYRRVGRSGLIDLQLPSGTQSAFVRQVQRHPVSQQFLHVDFRIVDLRTEIVADVPVVMVGENELVARGEGVLSIGHPTLHVRALPADLPQQIEVDISQITDFTTVIHVRDLNLGDKVQVLTAEDDNVVTVTP
ncbi:MAG: 50S ribosomal protein L25, partial [Chloroflexota bacterium]|nr:50S ribosomal protein L25 [Chloroflexota bacterium]